jgi:Ala-tRNA(Pro) deacylase
MPPSPAELALLNTLHRLGVTFQSLEHAAVFTVAESADIHHALPGFHTKNLFLKDEGGVFWLVTTPADAAIDIKALRHKIGSKRLSFGKPEAMMELLGLEPGSVTPLAVINDTGGKVTLVLDTALTGEAMVNVHPLRNTATIGMKGTDLVRVVSALGHTPKIVQTGDT